MNALYQELLARLENSLAVLPDKNDETPELTLRALWAMAQDTRVSVSRADSVTLNELTDARQAHIRELVEQRLQGVPLAHITERQSFMGLELRTTPDALIPRVETEILAKLALRCLENVEPVHQPLVLDICTGCGNLALAIANLARNARVYGSDLSEKAVALAQENSQLLSLSDRTEFYCGDLLEPFRSAAFIGLVDILICNPPYIIATNVEKMPKEISDHEPRMAFDGGPLGIAIIERTIREAPEFLKNGGWLCLEVGAGQGPFIEKRIAKLGFYQEVETASDNAGIVRAIRCQKK